MLQTVLSRLAPTARFSSPELRPLQAQVDQLVSTFLEEAANPRTLAAITVGGLAYRVGRVGVMSAWGGQTQGLPLRFLSIVAGLGSEVTAFEFTNRAFQTLSSPITHHSSPNVWRWSGPGGWGEGLATSAITFGMLRSAGFLAREQNIVLQHAFQSSAMVAGHQVVGGWQLIPRAEGSLAEQFLHAEITNLQLGAGMGLVHAMGPGISAMERGMDLSLQNVGTTLNSRPNMAGPYAGVPRHEAWNPLGPRRVWEMAGEGDRPRRNPTAMLTLGSGEGGRRSKRPVSLTLLLQRLTKIEDRERAQEAFRLLSAGVYGPLQHEIARAMVRFEMGHELKPLVEKLVNDGRIKTTIFLSPDYLKEVVAAIDRLEREKRPSQTVSPSQATESERDPSAFLSDELLHANIKRYEALRRIYRHPEEPSALSTEELQQETFNLLSYFVKTSRLAIEMADHDFLTGLYNPQALSRLAPDLERRLFANRRDGEAAKRSDWVLMLDIDFFKMVNDTYGHENGNEVLRKIAQVIKQTVRTRDIVARYGGEEVFIFLFNSGRNGAERAAEKIRQAVEATEISLKGFPPIRVTVSLGAAEMRLKPGTESQENPPLEGTLQNATDRADQAMYQAKAAGRNKVMISE